MSVVTGFLLTLAGAFVGWFARGFVRDPLAEFLNLRRTGMRLILKHEEDAGRAQATGLAENERVAEKRQKAITNESDELFGLSLDFLTLSITAPWLYFFLRKFFDLEMAAGAVGSLANNLNERRTQDWARYRETYMKALRLK
jgi:hypothetical protein